MIKLTNTDVYGWEAAIRGMRNPKNSWDKSDSICNLECRDYDFCYGCPACHDDKLCDELIDNRTYIGPNDHTIMKKLANAGVDHGKFLRMITVTVDINAPLYWWKEFDTYKVGTVANSCSTMHKIHAKPFETDDFSHEHLDCDSYDWMEGTIELLNNKRELYIITKSKDAWWQLIQLLPSSYNQLRTVQLNYQVLKNMYHARKNHKLDEWRDFCEWIKTLPYSELITGEE